MKLFVQNTRAEAIGRNTVTGFSDYGGSIGPLAMISCELRQAWKGATVTADSCAGMWLLEPPPSISASEALKNRPFLRQKRLRMRICALIFP